MEMQLLQGKAHTVEQEVRKVPPPFLKDGANDANWAAEGVLCGR